MHAVEISCVKAHTREGGHFQTERVFIQTQKEKTHRITYTKRDKGRGSSYTKRAHTERDIQRKKETELRKGMQQRINK